MVFFWNACYKERPRGKTMQKEPEGRHEASTENHQGRPATGSRLGGLLRLWRGGMTRRPACRQQLNKPCLAPSAKSLKSLVSRGASQRIKPKRALTPFALLVFLAMVEPAYATGPGEQALAWAESQRDAALGAVLVARNRLEAAESDLAVSRNVEREISNSKDAAALAVIREAVSVSEQGVLEAKALLGRAQEFLVKQQNLAAAVGKFIADNGSNKALVIPIKGEVRRIWQGVPINATDALSPLRVNESIEVGPGGSARLFVAGGEAEIVLSQKSSLTATHDEADGSFEALLSYGLGRFRAHLIKYRSRFEVRTPSGSGAIRGTDFSVKAFSSGSRFEVFKGVVWVHPIDSDEGVEVHAGEGCDILKEGGVQAVLPLDNLPRENPWGENAP